MLRFADNLRICILDAMFRQDSRGPVSTASHDLSMNCTLFTVRLRAQWRQGMLDIFSARKLRALNTNETFILASPTLDQEIIHFRVAFVFVSLNTVPSQYKMLGNVINTGTHQTHGDVVPGHTAIIGFVEFIVLPVFDALKVHDTIIVEILAGEDLILYTSWMDVCKGVLMVIPSAKAEIDAADEGNFVVNDHGFFMVGL